MKQSILEDMTIAVNTVGIRTTHRSVSEVKERRRTSCQSCVRNKGKLVVAHRQKRRRRAPLKFYSC